MATITLNEIAYDILGLNRAEIKDTDSLEVREVKFWVNTLRAKLLKQKFDKPMSTVDNNYVQSLGAVQLEKVDSSIKTTLPADRFFLRTKIDIPPTIERSGHVGTFTRVGPADLKEVEYLVVSHDRAIQSGFGKFSRNFVYCFPLDNKLWFTSRNTSHLDFKYVDVRGVFQNPKEAALILDSTYTDDDNYPINMQLVDEIKMILAQKELKLKNLQFVDKTSDGEKNVEQEVKTK